MYYVSSTSSWHVFTASVTPNIEEKIRYWELSLSQIIFEKHSAVLPHAVHRSFGMVRNICVYPQYIFSLCAVYVNISGEEKLR